MQTTAASESTNDTLSVRFRPRATQALEYLIESGQSKSDAVQAAIVAAAQAKRNAEMRRQSLALRDDPDDVAEMKAISDFYDSLD